MAIVLQFITQTSPPYLVSCSFFWLNKMSIHHVLCKKKILAYKNFYRISSIFGILVYGGQLENRANRSIYTWSWSRLAKAKLIPFIYILSFGLGKQKEKLIDFDAIKLRF